MAWWAIGGRRTANLWQFSPSRLRRYIDPMTDSLDDTIIETPEGPMTFAEWKKKNPVQLPSRRTKGKNLPNKVKRFTDKP